jgi:hypothetical protein
MRKGVPFLATIPQIAEDSPMPNTQAEESGGLANKEDKRHEVAVRASRDAKAKNARLRLLKERHENYLAEQRGDDADMERTEELRVAGGD